jgi:hypothetical protein
MPQAPLKSLFQACCRVQVQAPDACFTNGDQLRWSVDPEARLTADPPYDFGVSPRLAVQPVTDVGFHCQTIPDMADNETF